MSLNHHILAKATTDAVLAKFKCGEWSYGNGFGQDFYRVGTNADFPSPDAAFYDSTNHNLASFEFKPPTETKRGILTGIGQAIAYLQSCDLSFLIAPRQLEDYDLGTYLMDLFQSQLGGKLPVGLILYEKDDPSHVTLAHHADLPDAGGGRRAEPRASRFWAKHQDLPIQLFHLLLHYYYLKKVHIIDGDPFARCWRERLISPSILEDFSAVPVYDLSGNRIMTVAGEKPIQFLEKTLANTAHFPPDKRKVHIAHAIDTTFTGDNYFNALKKNYVTFLKHLQVIDSENNLTERGFALYHLGLVNGPSSKVFTDYFTKEVLTTGHHLDLILDFDRLRQLNPTDRIDSILPRMEADYESKGYLKRNPNRQQNAVSQVKFLKYERILWKALKLMGQDYTIQWRKITEICSLPDLGE